MIVSQILDSDYIDIKETGINLISALECAIAGFYCITYKKNISNNYKSLISLQSVYSITQALYLQSLLIKRHCHHGRHCHQSHRRRYCHHCFCRLNPRKHANLRIKRSMLKCGEDMRKEEIREKKEKKKNVKKGEICLSRRKGFNSNQSY